MTFYEQLQTATEPDRLRLQSTPIIRAALAGRVGPDEYIQFLAQAYQHVRHTVPLMMACGARLGPKYEWLREMIAEYIEEEIGHQEWILNDIAAAGGDADYYRHAPPHPATELMVSYAYDTINRGNPVGFFGMVYVLESTSTQLATLAAQKLQGALGLPKKAFTYLNTHGVVDIKHVEFFRNLVDRLDNESDRQAVLHAAHMFFRLYGDVFASIEPKRLAA